MKINRISFDTAPVSGSAKVKEIAVRGLRDLAAVRRIQALLAALETTVETKVKARLSEIFRAEGCQSRAQPPSFIGTDQGTQASCQLRARHYGNMSDATIAELTKAGFAITEGIVYSFNNEVLADPKMRRSIEVALSRIPGMPANVIQRTVTRSLRPDAIAKLFAGKPALVEDALPLCSTLAVRCDPPEDSDDVTDDLRRVSALMPAFKMRK